MLYHLAGWLNTIFFFICIYGLWLQLETIWKRKRANSNLSPTAVLSLNHFAVRFLAFYAYFLFGLYAEPVNHYLIWPRLIAIFILIAIIYEIKIERRNAVTDLAFYFSVILLSISFFFWLLPNSFSISSRDFSNAAVLLIGVLIVQSDLHQIYLMRKAKDSGAVAATTHLTTILKDVTTVLLGITMGFTQGWPIILVSTLSIVTKTIIFFQVKLARSF